MSSRALLALLLALLVAACQPLPRPFEDPNKEANDLLKLANRGGVVVLPIEGVPSPAAFAEAIATELRRLEVPATTARVGTAETLRLTGRAEATARDPGRDQLEIAWRLVQPNGAGIGRPGSWLVPHDPGARADPQTMAGVAQLAAPELAELIEGDRPVTQPGPSVVVWSDDGAPGDGAVTLKAALERSLRRAGYRVLATLAEDSLVVSAAITVRPAGPGKERVAVAWTVLDQDGTELGQIDQENVITAGLLNGPWGEIARQVAGAALEGIAEVVDQPRKKAGG